MPRVSRSDGPGLRERGARVRHRRQHVEREHALRERRLLVAAGAAAVQQPFVLRVLHPEARRGDRELLPRRQPARMRDREERDAVEVHLLESRGLRRTPGRTTVPASCAPEAYRAARQESMQSDFPVESLCGAPSGARACADSRRPGDCKSARKHTSNRTARGRAYGPVGWRHSRCSAVSPWHNAPRRARRQGEGTCSKRLRSS